MLARMWHIPDGLLTPTTEDYGCATIIGRLWLPKRVQRLRTGLQPCLRRQPRVVDEQPRRSPEVSNNQNTERFRYTNCQRHESEHELFIGRVLVIRQSARNLLELECGVKVKSTLCPENKVRRLVRNPNYYSQAQDPKPVSQ